MKRRNINWNCQSESESVDDNHSALFGSLRILGFLGSGGFALFSDFDFFLAHATHPGHPDLPLKISGAMGL